MRCANERNIQSYLCRTSVGTYYSTVYTLTLPPGCSACLPRGKLVCHRILRLFGQWKAGTSNHSTHQHGSTWTVITDYSTFELGVLNVYPDMSESASPETRARIVFECYLLTPFFKLPSPGTYLLHISGSFVYENDPGVLDYHHRVGGFINDR